jgi:HAD superfamily hydrolase (TIGR01549 family)
LTEWPVGSTVTGEYEAVVYDLDGTLVDLDVDWDAVREECAALVRARGVDPAERTIHEILEVATERGFRPRLNETIAEFERDGARSADRLPAADDLPHSVLVGVCSLNAVDACRIALQLHGLDAHVDVVVGRDSLPESKPHPAPLLETVQGLGVAPDEAIFIGDSDTDAECADRASVDFEDVRER